MLQHKRKGLFITLEGGEGAGKSTQALQLAKRLRADGYHVCQTREPGGTPGAESLRNLLLFDDLPLSWRAEIMVHMAARCDHLDLQILPALARGEIVICDRYHDSTLAYQGFGIGYGKEPVLSFIQALRKQVGCEADMTLWLDVPLEKARERVMKRGIKSDRYDGQERRFHERVAEGFQYIAEHDSQRVKRVDALGSLEDVHEILYHIVQKRLQGEE